MRFFSSSQPTVPSPTAALPGRPEPIMTPGRHSIAVRATDHDGQVQTDERADPFPDGATGWHEIVVNVEG